jgi:mannosyltransferase OCH1-like enzyme
MDWYNADLIAQSRNPGEISDIMRYEILYHFGGVYIDFDFECLQSLDELNSLYDFYVGIQPLDSEFLQLGIGLIGSVVHHPILRAAIDHMRPAWADPKNAGNAPAKTGPIYFTKIFFMMADSFGMRDIALPAHYFHPLTCNQEDFQYEQWLADGAFGVHHWAKSWLLPQFRKSEFRQLN